MICYHHFNELFSFVVIVVVVVHVCAKPSLLILIKSSVHFLSFVSIFTHNMCPSAEPLVFQTVDSHVVVIISSDTNKAWMSEGVCVCLYSCLVVQLSDHPVLYIDMNTLDVIWTCNQCCHMFVSGMKNGPFEILLTIIWKSTFYHICSKTSYIFIHL